jgi:exonuclease SbcC
MALQLLDGQACPVCGSLDHPAPAKAHEDQPVWVSLIEARASLVEMKREACTTHREQRSRAEFNIKRLDQEAEALQRDLASAGFSAAADVLERLETLAAQSRQLDDAIKPLEQLLATRPGLEAEANKALLALEKATLHREALDRALAQLEGERVQLAKGAGDPEDPAAALRSVQADLRTRQQGLLEQDGNIQAIETAQHKAEVDLASRTAEQAAAAQTMEGFDTRLRELEAACTIGLKESAFPSADLALAALLPDGDRDQLMETLQVHQAAASRISHLLEDLARRLNDRDRPDLETLADLEKAALVERTEAQAAREIASRNLDQHREWSERWLELEQQWKELQEQGGIYVQLAADLNGQGKGGKEKLSFSSFVLGRWLARVLDKATLHLLALTGGRYRFLHKDLEEDRRKKAGLDIDIHDAHSGAARAVTTLSGGEKFLASLSLALGLSDVIQAWSGGRRLEALFIDEGFGSLDGESLDKALAVLEGIGGGRQVGIISHVEGLKAILESRIEVEKGLAGSKVRIVNRAPAVE